jgi:hypothetical protein
MNIKYTQDNKKVHVVSQLNSNQSIVQEVFVDNSGNEVLAGEQFVVNTSSLTDDSGLITWKESKLKELEQSYESRKTHWINSINEMERTLSETYEKANIKLNYLLDFIENSDVKELQTLNNFLTGKITHYYMKGHSPAIYSFEDKNSYKHDLNSKRIDGIKLLSLFGDSKGYLSYRLNRYRDGSGGWIEIVPACSYQEALSYAQEDLNEQCERWLDEKWENFHRPDFTQWLKIKGIVIPKEAAEKYNEIRKAQDLERIEKLEMEIMELKTGLNTIETIIV